MAWKLTELRMAYWKLMRRAGEVDALECVRRNASSAKVSCQARHYSGDRDSWISQDFPLRSFQSLHHNFHMYIHSRVCVVNVGLSSCRPVPDTKDRLHQNSDNPLRS